MVEKPRPQALQHELAPGEEPRSAIAERSQRSADQRGHQQADKERQRHRDQQRQHPEHEIEDHVPAIGHEEGRDDEERRRQRRDYRQRVIERARRHIGIGSAHPLGLVMVERPVEHAHIAVHQAALAVLGMAVRLEEIGRQHRRDHARDGERHQHRDDDGDAEILEELARNARHQADGEEHRDDAEAGRHHRQADLVGRVDTGLIGAFAHTHMAHDVLDLHDRIVDQHARDEAQRQQGQRVEIEAQQIHEPEGRDRGEGDRHGGNRGRAPVAQEEEHHHDRQDRAFDHRAHRAGILFLGVFDRVEQGDEVDAGIFRLDRRDFLFCGGEDGDVGGTLGAAHAEIDDLSIAHLADRGPFRIAVAHGGDIGQPHRSAVAQLDLALAQFIGGFGAAEDAHRLARAADLGRAARRVDIGLAQHLIDLARRDPIRLHPRQIEDHLDLAIDAREAIDLGHALDGEQPLGDRVVDEPAQLLDRHVVGLDGVDRQEAAGNLLLLHARFEDPVGQAAPDGVDRIRDLDRRVVGIGADLELYESVGIALARRGIERFDPVDRADRRFHPLGDLVLDLGRGGARLRD